MTAYFLQSYSLLVTCRLRVSAPYEELDNFGLMYLKRHMSNRTMLLAFGVGGNSNCPKKNNFRTCHEGRIELSSAIPASARQRRLVQGKSTM